MKIDINTQTDTAIHPAYMHGYCRVSTEEQNVDLQVNALKKHGCDEIYTDIMSGSIRHRKELDKMLFKLRKGDQVVVWKLDRLGRSLRDFIQITDKIAAAGADLVCIQDKIDTSTPTGRLLFHILAVLAEFERELIRERTIAGLDAAKKRGVKVGRKSKLTADQERLLMTLHLSPHCVKSKILEQFDISKATYHRIVNKHPDFKAERQTDILEFCS